MAEEGSSASSRELDQTPTWAVSLVCAIIIIISIVLEKLLHTIGMWFQNRRKKALFEALEKIKAELMVLGFISLLLTFGQNYIASICIPVKFADTMLPCPNSSLHNSSPSGEVEHHNRRRLLSAEVGAIGCKNGFVPMISTNGLHQLHIFIFFLAVFHVIYSAITMMLGRLKIRRWKEWEQFQEQEANNDPSIFRLTHETSFVKGHSSFWTRTPFLFYVVCFFRQFIRSVRKADYLTMRHGFISVHLAPGSKFDFQKYIKRSLEDDFKVVVGISPVLWASAVIYLLANVHGWHAMFWLSLLPVIVILAVGTKLQAIITQMAIEIQERHAVVQGIPLVQVSDRHFWFGWPTLMLYLIHLTLFQNSFEITYFLWVSYEFGFDACFHEGLGLAIGRVALAAGAIILCSYITLPLYALVTQMGSNMKKSIFDDQTSKALMQWHKNAVKKKSDGKTGTRTLGESSTPVESPKQQQHRHIRNSNIEMANANANANASSPTQKDEHITVVGSHDLLTGP